jgi:hypothetical protein
MQLSGEVRAQLEKRFAEPDRPMVGALLETCRNEAVIIAVLRLSRGKVARVQALVESAARDYRDVLAAASQPTRTYVVGLLRKGPAWSEKDEGGRTHLDPRQLQAWKHQGAVLVGGWFMDLTDPRGLYIFTVDSVAEAEALVQSDPAVQSGKLVFEFHPWLAPDGLRIASPDEL